ncbi:probable RNA helicase armi isoform X2 [Sitodiplosis mosellana]|uniref:probable RNA helicase armi isoform X2 n=1 Tax=Sitodiplosis mosellana TaxID=263140 RepID=UPI0024437B89|nr:probable RNA helicase armi isoform X2 [Sitodiplosis mosellana]
MPLATDIEVTDDLELTFDKSHTKKLFKVTLKNKELLANKSTEGTLRFNFNSRKHVTRTFKLVDKSKAIKRENDTALKSMNESVKENEKKEVKKDVKMDGKKESKKRVKAEAKERDLKVAANDEVKSESKNKVKKVEVPKPTRGLLYVDLPKEDLCIKEFHKEHPPALDVDDKLSIRFDRDQCDKSCEILIRNNTWKPIHLEAIHIDILTVTVRGGSCEAIIEPRGEKLLILDAVYVPDRFVGVARVAFHFKRMTVVRRSISIFYRERGPVIQRELYDIPEDLIHMIYADKRMAKSKMLGFLDSWLLSIEENYPEHFHRLLYLEEEGLRKEIKEVYNDKYKKFESYFGDTERFKKDDQEVKQNYAHGIYDLQVNELNDETRPSLQVGDKLTVRKHSELGVSYEGFIIDVKDVDIIVIKFNDDFVATFDHSAYSIEFAFSRSYFLRQHFAIDLAVELYGMDILMPKEISLRGVPLLDMRMKGNNGMIQRRNGKQQPWFNDNLNKQQKQAVTQIMRSDLLNPYLIFGPPGTGKTTTLVEIILQLLASNKKSKILITTQSNSASNLITQRLIQSKQLHSDSLLRLISHNYSSRTEFIPDDVAMYSKTIKDLEEIEQKKMTFFERLELVKKYRVVIGTFSAVSKLLEAASLRNHFTHSVIDEAGQCTETDALVPMVLVGKGGQTIMAGDPMQMPPLVINWHANTRGLAVSMLDRLIECYSNFNNDDAGHKKYFGPRLISNLVHSYRSLPSLLAYTSQNFYRSELIPMIDAETSREAKLLKHLHGIFQDMEKPGTYGIHFVNVDDSRNQKWKTSWYNISEVHVSVKLVEELIQSGLSEEDIGIITPYSVQLRALKKYHNKQFPKPNMKIGTIEDFQGLERKVILISTVRTCSTETAVDVNRRLGFVKCPNRINVATSRARVMCIVIGKADLLSHDKHWQALIAGCKENHTYTESIMKYN